MDPASEATGLDIATAIVAGYAALVATVALAFNFFSWLRTWQTRLKIDLRRMESVTPGDPASREPVVFFHLINHSGHVVKVTSVALAPITKGGPHLFIGHPLPLPRPGPFEVQPRDSTSVYVRPEVISDGDPEHKTRAEIGTSDRRSFNSKWVRLRDLLEDAPAKQGDQQPEGENSEPSP